MAGRAQAEEPVPDGQRKRMLLGQFSSLNPTQACAGLMGLARFRSPVSTDEQGMARGDVDRHTPVRFNHNEVTGVIATHHGNYASVSATMRPDILAAPNLFNRLVPQLCQHKCPGSKTRLAPNVEAFPKPGPGQQPPGHGLPKLV